MTRTKTTKKALLASMLSMLLCVAMLIGSTFAWFTDSITSGKNKIIAGNLDVDLEYTSNPADGTSWKTADGAEDLFDKDALWEPGHTEVIYVKVVNKGSLALKYRFNVGAADKVIGYTEDDKPIDLTDFIKFGVVNGIETAYTDRATARAAVEDSSVNIAKGYIAEDAVLEKGEESSAMAIVVYMPEEVDNRANHGKDKTVPQIDLALNVVATQAMVESDSFDNTYDEYAEYPVPVLVADNAAGVAAALEEIPDGGEVELAGDVELGEEAALYVADKDVTLDINGHTLESASQETTLTVDNGADVTLTGGKIVFTQTHSEDLGGESGTIPYIAVLNKEDSAEETTSMTIENCTIEFKKLLSKVYDPLDAGIYVDAPYDGKKAELNIGEGALIDCKMSYGNAITIGINATVNMTGGKLIANGIEEESDYYVWGVYLDNVSSVFNMTGGEIDVTGVSNVSGIVTTWSPCMVNISGGEINVDAYSATSSSDAKGIDADESSIIKMTGGTINLKKTAPGNMIASEAIHDSRDWVDITVNGEAQIILDQSVEGNSVELGFNPDTHPKVDQTKINYITD